MIILVDGYNLLKGASGGREVNEAERRSFIQKLGIYGKRKKHKMVVVFDGGDSTWPFKEKIAEVVVIYSGAKQTADKVIKHYIADHPSKEILLVTTDRDLNHYAAKNNKVSIDSGDFLVLLTDLLASPMEQELEVSIVIDENETDLEIIMEQATAIVPQKADDIPRRAIAALSTMSKKDRVLMKKLKKL